VGRPPEPVTTPSSNWGQQVTSAFGPGPNAYSFTGGGDLTPGGLNNAVQAFSRAAGAADAGRSARPVDLLSEARVHGTPGQAGLNPAAALSTPGGLARADRATQQVAGAGGFTDVIGGRNGGGISPNIGNLGFFNPDVLGPLNSRYAVKPSPMVGAFTR
jgi:hypothetical protein